MAITKVLYLGEDASGFTAAHDRWSLLNWWSEGVRPTYLDDGRNAMKVSQRGAGANFSVDVAPGWAIVQGDDAVNQGSYALYNDVTINLPHASGAPSTNPRVDIVILQVNDAEHTARTPSNSFELKWLYGTPTAGANLVNRSGAPTVPATALHLADVLVNVGQANIQDSSISEKRTLSGPLLCGEDGKTYRLGINAAGDLGLEALN